MRWVGGIGIEREGERERGAEGERETEKGGGRVVERDRASERVSE